MIIKKTLFVVLFLSFFLIGLEVFYRFFFLPDWLSGHWTGYHSVLDYRGTRPYRNRPGADTYMKLLVNQQVRRKIHVRTDAFGRRKNPLPKNRNSPHLVMLGDSLVFGYAVNEHETLPFHLSKKLARTSVYNYGVIGVGVENNLSYLNEWQPQKELSSFQGKAIYVLYTGGCCGHVERSLGAFQLNWSDKLDYYEIHNDKIHRRGRHYSNSPFLYKYFFPLLRTFKIHFLFAELQFTKPKATEKLAQLLVELSSRYKKATLAKNDFYVLFHPWSENLDQLKIISKHLKENRIPFLDYSRLFLKRDYRLKDDWHINSAGNEVLSQHIYRDVFL